MIIAEKDAFGIKKDDTLNSLLNEIKNRFFEEKKILSAELNHDNLMKFAIVTPLIIICLI